MNRSLATTLMIATLLADGDAVGPRPRKAKDILGIQDPIETPRELRTKHKHVVNVGKRTRKWRKQQNAKRVQGKK